MSVINIQSIQDEVSKGTLIELATDYRMSRTVRAVLPRNTPYALAISAGAFNRHVQQGTVQERQSRIEAICGVLSKALGLGGRSSLPDLQVSFAGQNGKTESFALKLEWYAPNKYWVILLPDEKIQPALKFA